MTSCTKLILYLTATYPSTKMFLDILEKSSRLVDMFEIGIPTQNPKYDGPTIRTTHKGSEVKGLKALDVVKNVALKDFVVMAYMEDYVDNIDVLFEKCSEIGARGVLLPDLLFDFYDMVDIYYRKCVEYSLEPCFFISSKFPYKWVEKLLRYRPFFIYLGLQACSGIRLPIFIERNVKIYRSIINDSCDLIVGFAIKSPEDVKLLVNLNVDGIVIGSAFIREVMSRGVEYGLKLLEDLKKVLKGE